MSLVTSASTPSQTSSPAYTHSAQPDANQLVTLLDQLYRERALITYAANHTVPLQHQDMYLVYRGVVQLHTIHADGGETIVGLCGPSTVFGKVMTSVEPYWATALSEVDLLSFSMTEVESSPALMAAVFPQIMRRLQQTEAWLAVSGKRLVCDRLRFLIIQLAQDFGHVEPSGVRIKLRLTHHQIATIIGTTRVTVTRLLRDFKREGWLTVQKRQFILSPKAAGIAHSNEFSTRFTTAC